MATKILDEQSLQAALQAYTSDGYVVRTGDFQQEEPTCNYGWILGWGMPGIPELQARWPDIPQGGYAYLLGYREAEILPTDPVNILPACNKWVLEGYSQPPIVGSSPDVDYALVWAQQRAILVNREGKRRMEIQTLLVFGQIQ